MLLLHSYWAHFGSLNYLFIGTFSSFCFTISTSWHGPLFHRIWRAIINLHLIRGDVILLDLLFIIATLVTIVVLFLLTREQMKVIILIVFNFGRSTQILIILNDLFDDIRRKAFLLRVVDLNFVEFVVLNDYEQL